MTRALLVVNSTENLRVHRAPLVRGLARAGFDVHVALPSARNGPDFPEASTHEFTMSRRTANPLRDIPMLLGLRRIVREVRPHVVHSFTLKPALYATMAAREAGVPRILCSLTGLGYVFTQNHGRVRFVRSVLSPALRASFRHPAVRVIVQNEDDRALVLERRMVPADRLLLVRGSGVDTELFRPTAEPSLPLTVLFAGRLLKTKGILEFLQAAQLLRDWGLQVRMVVVGQVDPGNPASLPADILERPVKSGLVEWWGWQDDMASVLAGTHIACLPSYREGLPRFLLEAAAMGRAIVATDVPGCREVVTDNVTGLLVPSQNGEAVARAIERLSLDPALRRQLGANARALVEKDFSINVFLDQMLALHRSADV